MTGTGAHGGRLGALPAPDAARFPTQFPAQRGWLAGLFRPPLPSPGAGPLTVPFRPSACPYLRLLAPACLVFASSRCAWSRAAPSLGSSRFAPMSPRTAPRSRGHDSRVVAAALFKVRAGRDPAATGVRTQEVRRVCPEEALRNGNDRFPPRVNPVTSRRGARSARRPAHPDRRPASAAFSRGFPRPSPPLPSLRPPAARRRYVARGVQEPAAGPIARNP
jgi:hypothetical protein